MSSINMKSVLSKAGTYMNSKSGQTAIKKVVDKAMLGKIKLQSGHSTHTPEEAAVKFIEVLRGAINSSGLNPNAIEAISNIEHSAAYSLGNNVYSITVYFAGDLGRPSLNEDKYGRINDLAALFNNGVDHKMKPVHGVWHGRETWSRTVIPQTHFVEQAIADFMGSYGADYNVISISTQGF